MFLRPIKQLDVDTGAVVDSCIGTLRKVNWLFHLNKLKAEILFEVVSPLMKQLDGSRTIVGLSFEWRSSGETKKEARVKVLSQRLGGPQKALRTEFLVTYSTETVEKLEKVIIWNERYDQLDTFDLYECVVE